MNELREMAIKYKARKYDWYLDAYWEHFKSCRNEVKVMVEIGVAFGGSGLMWCEFFTHCKYIGIDKKLPDRDVPFDILVGNQGNRKFMRSVASDIGEVDIVVDDGSHRMKHQKVSFEELFPIVKSGGWYVIEDLHTSYWPSYGGGHCLSSSMIEFLKSMIDNINNMWFVNDKRAGRFQQPARSLEQQYMDNHIKSIYFYDSLCLIRKK